MSTTPKKVTKPKAVKKKSASEHPPYNEMIKAAVVALASRSGSSRQAIAKYIKANYKVGEGMETHLKMGLKRAVENRSLMHVKGTGASGSFKLVKVEKKPKKPVAPKKPAAKKTTPKKDTPKKAAKKTPAPKKPAKKAPAKKEGVKKTTTKKPASKKPAAAKKATKPAAKKPAAKKSTPKKK